MKTGHESTTQKHKNIPYYHTRHPCVILTDYSMNEHYLVID